jgi:hypothetical protein
MPPEGAERRRTELDSDQGDMTELARAEQWSEYDLLIQRSLRWLLGVPADILWRLSLGRSSLSVRGLSELAVASLLVGGCLISVPLSIGLAVTGENFEGHAGSQRLMAFLVPVVLLHCVGGFLIQELKPLAGTVIALIGVLSISIALWWTFTAPAFGLLTAAGLLYRQTRLRG